jgi:hypothetical protein
MEKDFSGLHNSGSFMTGNEQIHLTKVTHYHLNGIMFGKKFREITEKVHGNGFP